MSTTWRERRERGSRVGLFLAIRIALHGGRALCRAVLVPVMLYFLATAPEARNASRDFLTRVRGRRAGLRDVFAHLYTFGTTLVDRIFLLLGRYRELAVEVEDDRVLLESLALGRGCLLFGSHLGSFELLGFVGSIDKRLPINIVMNVDANTRMHRMLAQRGGGLPYRIIAFGQPDTMLRVKECLERGEIVGLLVDRVYGGEATCALPFLGQSAAFSLAPFRLAAITGAPVVMAYALFAGGKRYRVSFAPLAERIERDRHAPCEGLLPWMQRYVTGLEAQARHAPHNWFNFYDYWAPPR